MHGQRYACGLAIGIPLYLAWAGAEGRPMLRALPPFPLAVVDIDTGQTREPLGDPDYQAIAALAECVRSGEGTALKGLPYHGRFYYPASLHLLALVAAREVAPFCLDQPSAAAPPGRR